MRANVRAGAVSAARVPLGVLLPPSQLSVPSTQGTVSSDAHLCLMTPAEFRAHVHAHCRFLPMPIVTAAALLELAEHKSLAGFQARKDRGTFQGCLLDVLAEGESPLCALLRHVREEVVAHGVLHNDFLNVNRGAGPGGYHVDVPTRGRPGAPNTGRVMAYGCSAGREAGVAFRGGGHEFHLVVPPGMMVYVANELLTGRTGVEHSHLALGMSISWVHEVCYEVMPQEATPQEVAEARRCQTAEQLDVEQLVGLAPSTLPTLKAIAGRFFSGGGSKERCE